MKRKEDIYKKPKKLLSDYLTVMMVTCVTILFISFEIYSFISKDNQVTTLVNTEVDKSKDLPDNNELTTEAKNLQTLEKQDEILPNTESLEVSNVPEDQNNIDEKPLNPLDDILKTKSELESWKLQNSYSDYSLDDKHKLLIHAIENNHADNLSKMLKKGFLFTTKLYVGDANKLILTRKYQVVFVLIQNDLLDISKPNKYGYTLLHEVSAKGHQALIRLIVLKGIDINAQALDGASALHYPSRLGYSITVKTLLALGINPNLRATLKYSGLYWNESTPLHIASKQGHIKVVKQLILAGADLNLKDGDGLTALDLAKNANKESVVDFLESALPQEDALPIQESNTTELESNTQETEIDSLQTLLPEDVNENSSEAVTEPFDTTDNNNSLVTIDSDKSDEAL